MFSVQCSYVSSYLLSTELTIYILTGDVCACKLQITTATSVVDFIKINSEQMNAELEYDDVFVLYESYLLFMHICLLLHTLLVLQLHIDEDNTK